MRCNKAEKWLLWSYDGRLDAKRRREMDEHLRSCPCCARMDKEYRVMRGLLANEGPAEPLPYFLERLKSRFAAEKKSFVLLLWERWCLRAVPVFLGAVLAFGLAVFFLVPPSQDQMAQSGLLFLNGQNPLSETQSILEEGMGEARQMRLIFAAADEADYLGREMP